MYSRLSEPAYEDRASDADKVLIRGARQLLTLNGPSGPRRGEAMNSLGLIEDGSILIINGVISAVGPTRRVENLAESKGAFVINATGHVVMPAFIDPHAHLIAGSSLIERDDFETPEQLSDATDTPRRGAYAAGQIRRTPAKTIEHRTRKLLDLCVRHGTLTLEAKSGYGLDENTETKLFRVIAHCNEESASLVPTYYIPAESYSYPSAQRDEFLRWITSEFLGRLHAKRLVKYVDIECNLSNGGAEIAPELFRAIQAVGLIPKMHTDGGDLRCIEVGTRFGVASIDGLDAVVPSAVEALRHQQSIATLLPGDLLQGLRESPTAARALINAGVPVALASGLHHGRNTTFNMQCVIALACSLLRMTTAESITASTINAAYSVGLASRIGSLQFGKDADIIILAGSDYRELSYYVGVNQVLLAMKRGRPLFHDSTFRL